MIIPQTIAGLASADTIQEILLHEKQNTMKIEIEPDDSDPKKPVEESKSNEDLPFLEFSNLSLNDKETDPEDDKTTSESNIKEDNESSDEEEIDPSKLVCKGPLRPKTNSSRAHNEPYAFPVQPSLAQTTFINGRQMAGSQVSETVWVESHENEIPCSVTELSELQNPLLENLCHPSTNIETLYSPDFSLNLLDEFTEEEIRRLVGHCQDINILGTESGMAADEGFNEMNYNLSDSFSGLDANLSESFSRVRTNSSEIIGVEANLSEGVSNEDPNSPDSAYGSIGLAESPRNSPKSDFNMSHGLSPRYLDYSEPEVLPNVYEHIGDQFNVGRPFLQRCDDAVTSWSLDPLTPQVPQIPLNIPAQDDVYDLLEIGGQQYITTYNIPGTDADVPSYAQNLETRIPPISCISPMNTNDARPEKKKTNQRMSPPKKNPPPLQSSGPRNVKPSNRRISSDRTLQERLEYKMKPLRKEAVWKKTIIETLEEFCKKNEQGQTPLMKLLLFEPRLPSIVEAVYTRIGRIKSEKLADLLCHRDDHGHCALYQAATLHPDIPEIAAYIAETYASFGCDVNKPYQKGNTILHYLAQLGDNFDQVLDELLRVTVNGERIFRIDQRNDVGNTPLHVAAEHHLTGSAGSTFRIASTLIKHRGSVSIQNSVGATPLHVAAKSKACQPEYFRKLLEQRGAENLQDEDGNTPLHLVALTVNVHNVEILKEVLSHLRTSNARMDTKNKEGRCPMDNVHQQCKEVIRNLIQPKRQ